MSTSFDSTKGRQNADPAAQGPGLAREVHVNRFYGGDADGVCVQVTIGNRYIQLTRAGAYDLIARLCRAASTKETPMTTTRKAPGGSDHAHADAFDLSGPGTASTIAKSMRWEAKELRREAKGLHQRALLLDRIARTLTPKP